MRLFLAVGLALIVGLGAAFGLGDNLPGREVGAAELSRVNGGGAMYCSLISCDPDKPMTCNKGISGGHGALQCLASCMQWDGGCAGG